MNKLITEEYCPLFPQIVLKTFLSFENVSFFQVLSHSEC